ncbi:16S rRNA (guanine(527)-N(7))-methyltransferase RsmG [Mycoplasmopsis equigenitalium]|uniref:Ribosomal RNA small subunit methyltransferase G n=1 Tax=Mycoplasmopsis equigenitalium TaxID=114883 RepID=A0ABY5J0S3_9BACT|nr:16S rRNA (guanine(527)-N(7))-methyltransferase RsmG [Mycoplasmopsis equigenitalium]UUD36854.1 16S rRNA (guanine(527)-N(7))-methyltransferase RsmG [Mycoplasmopsis equigenitalium]
MKTFEEQIAINYPKAYPKLKKYTELIEEHNLSMNLTGFTSDILWKDGIYESIKFLEKIDIQKDDDWVDIGSGAGFPCVPFLICHPELKLTILEPMLKRVKFLKEVAKTLELNIKVHSLRAEEFVHKDSFNIITARAVTSLKNLILSTYHLGKNDARFCFVKGQNVNKEITEAKKAIDFLKLKISQKQLSETEKNLNIICYQKTLKTPNDFPWMWSKILKY